jgi:hypothetical protein
MGSGPVAEVMGMLLRTMSFGVLIALAVAQPAAALTADEQAVVDAINAARVDAGLAPLTVSEELSALADSHSASMAGSDSLFHSSDLAGSVGTIYPNWTHVGENVGMGSTIESINAAFLASPEHAANIYGDYDLLGVGVETNPGGKLFVTELFVSADVAVVEPAPAPPVESVVAAPVSTESTARAARAVHPALPPGRAAGAHGVKRHGPPAWARASEVGRARSAASR